MRTQKLRLSEVKSMIRRIVKEETSGEEITSVKQLYRKYGKKYPYACDAVAYYIFGDKSDDNILIRAYKGVYGRGCEIDSSEVSQYMLDFEYGWEDHLSAIDDFIKNIETRDGSLLSDYF